MDLFYLLKINILYIIPFFTLCSSSIAFGLWSGTVLLSFGLSFVNLFGSCFPGFIYLLQSGLNSVRILSFISFL